MELVKIGKLLLIIGVIIIVAGLLVFLIGKPGLIGKLPSDILIQKGNFTFYFPVVTFVIISVVLTIIMNILLRLMK